MLFNIYADRKNVRFLKTDPKARYQGYMFYFKEGFCWSNTLNPYARLLKCRIKSKTINDVGAMSLTSTIESVISNEEIVCLLNSNFVFDYYRNFINNTVNIQINDIRQIPVKILRGEEKAKLTSLFYTAFDMRKSNRLSADEEKNIQSYLDNAIYDIYFCES